ATGFPQSEDLQIQAQTFADDSWTWAQSHWLQILIATGIAIAVFFLLQAIKGWGARLCKKGEGVANWYAIIGRAVAKTGNFFIL
ncbi:mechanosensitive ion channel family protein, partial [Escherichia coli]|nr:mechanosensitive ion channel family protein [Escherichia coli]